MADENRVVISVFRLGDPCFYCQVNVSSCWDHIVPYAWGGSDDLDNLVPACTLCNNMKRDLFLDEFASYCKRRRLPCDWVLPDRRAIHGTLHRIGAKKYIFHGDDGTREYLTPDEYSARTYLNAYKRRPTLAQLRAGQIARKKA